MGKGKGKEKEEEEACIASMDLERIKDLGFGDPMIGWSKRRKGYGWFNPSSPF